MRDNIKWKAYTKVKNVSSTHVGRTEEQAPVS